MAKHKISYALSAVAMTLGSGILAPMAFAEGETPFCIEGGECYGTLQAAFDQVPSDGTLTTVYLESKEDTVYDGGGAFYTRGKKTSDGLAHPANDNYNVVFDLKGKTYVISGAPVGSTGYETQAFHLEKGGKFTFKDGTVKAASNSGVWFILQNYADTTLDNVTLDGSDNARVTYVASNNFGSLTAKGGSQILASSGKVAFDLWYGMNEVYDDGIIVNFGDDFTGKVVGKIEYGKHNRVSDTEWQKKAELNISNGTFDVTFAEGSTGALNGANINISGGTFSTEPKEDEIEEGSEAYKTENGYVVANPDELARDNQEYADDDEDGIYELMPIKIDMMENGAMVSDGSRGGAIAGSAVFESEYIADRKAEFELAELDEDEIEALQLDATKGGDLILAFDASLWDRNGDQISNVSGTSIKIRVNLTEEQYNTLKEYDKVQVAYFDEQRVEQERLDATLGEYADGGYYAEFTTTHLSTYGLVGAAETAETTTSSATPETGTMTREGTSASVAALVTAVAVGLLTTIVSFAYLVRKH